MAREKHPDLNQLAASIVRESTDEEPLPRLVRFGRVMTHVLGRDPEPAMPSDSEQVV